MLEAITHSITLPSNHCMVLFCHVSLIQVKQSGYKDVYLFPDKYRNTVWAPCPSYYSYCFISSILAIYFFFCARHSAFCEQFTERSKKHAWLITFVSIWWIWRRNPEAGVTKFKFILQVLASLFLPLPVTILQLIHHQAYAGLWIVAASACFPHPLPGVFIQVLQWHGIALRVLGTGVILLNITHIMGCCTAEFYFCMMAVPEAHLKTNVLEMGDIY